MTSKIAHSFVTTPLFCFTLNNPGRSHYDCFYRIRCSSGRRRWRWSAAWFIDETLQNWTFRHWKLMFIQDDPRWKIIGKTQWKFNHELTLLGTQFPRKIVQISLKINLILIPSSQIDYESNFFLCWNSASPKTSHL